MIKSYFTDTVIKLEDNINTMLIKENNVKLLKTKIESNLLEIDNLFP